MIPILPLPLFQPTDVSQLSQLNDWICKIPPVIYYYLRQLIFPACLIFQKLKLSACGHELGSTILFPYRIGFSGTPSNLLPMDLGQCEYEPTSDGKILHVLTNPMVTSIEVKSKDWTAKSLLYDIATSGQYHALIDTGALITGLDNLQVAQFLLHHLPSDTFEGVVFLDTSDRQMILCRYVPFPLNLLQCGIAPEHRFTFYDQIHTTGMDIKHYSMACAVLTIGKDMTFRDYAQGAYRMRGIGKGQTIHVFLIPEIQHQLNLSDRWGETGGHPDLLLTQVPAWLLCNSMRMERMQLIQLSKQEIDNVWRKQALKVLLQTQSSSLAQRFDSDKTRQAIELYRETISFDIETDMSNDKSLHEKMVGVVKTYNDSLSSLSLMANDHERIQLVLERIQQIQHSIMDDNDAGGNGENNLNAEMVTENEIEAEEEAEEEAEQEEEKMNMYCRDDELPHPWPVSILSSPTPNGAVFYPLATFQPTTECPLLTTFPSSLYLSSNFFRREWIGLGSRRVKNVGLVLEWIPQMNAKQLQERVRELFQHFVLSGDDQATAVSKAMAKALQQQAAEAAATSTERRYSMVVSLAEGETLRHMIHEKHPLLGMTGLAIRTLDGQMLDCSFQSSGVAVGASAQAEESGIETQCLRFFNNEMYYTEDQLEDLRKGLVSVPMKDRVAFFEAILILRRRERHIWGDTPLAKLFTHSNEYHLLHVRALCQQLQRALARHDVKSKNRLYLLYKNDSSSSSLRYDQVSKLLMDQLHLGFSAADVSNVIRFMDKDQTGEVSFETIAELLKWTYDEDEEHKGETSTSTWICSKCTFRNDMELDQKCRMCQEEAESVWKCSNCTYSNPIHQTVCEICEMNASGQRQVPRGKWVCEAEFGGCTFFNPNDLYYCHVCHRARPDLTFKAF